MAKKRKGAEQAPAEQPEQAPEAKDAAEDEQDASSSEPSCGSGEDGSSSSTDGEASDGSSAPLVSSDEPEDADDEDKFEEIDVDFQFFDPKEGDYHGLKTLLHTFLDGAQYDGAGLAETIIAQHTVGTVVKTGEDDDPIAVMTALGTRRYADRPFMGQVKGFLLGKCGGDEALRKAFQEAWDAPGTALLINERLINAPPALAPPLLQALLDEVGWATEDEPTQELRDGFRFKRYLLVTRVYSDPAAAAGAAEAGGSGGGGERKKKKQKKAGPPGGGPLLVYVRPEDEFLHAVATASTTWPVEGRAVGRDELQPMRLAMVVSAEAAAGARRELDRVVGNAAAMAPPPPMGGGGGKGGKGKAVAAAAAGGGGKGKGKAR